MNFSTWNWKYWYNHRQLIQSPSTLVSDLERKNVWVKTMYCVCMVGFVLRRSPYPDCIASNGRMIIQRNMEGCCLDLIKVLSRHLKNLSQDSRRDSKRVPSNTILHLPVRWAMNKKTWKTNRKTCRRYRRDTKHKKREMKESRCTEYRSEWETKMIRIPRLCSSCHTRRLTVVTTADQKAYISRSHQNLMDGNASYIFFSCKSSLSHCKEILFKAAERKQFLPVAVWPQCYWCAGFMCENPPLTGV